MYIYIYAYICICIYIYMCVYIYIYTSWLGWSRGGWPPRSSAEGGASTVASSERPHLTGEPTLGIRETDYKNASPTYSC